MQLKVLVCSRAVKGKMLLENRLGFRTTIQHFPLQYSILVDKPPKEFTREDLFRLKTARPIEDLRLR